MASNIVPYSKADKPHVLSIFKMNTPEFFSEEEEADLNHYLENETEEYFVVKNDNQIIGSGGINYKKAKSIGIISWDIIHPKHQGVGVGGQLLDYRLNILRSKKSVQKIIVRTSQEVFKFYEKSGFELKEVKKDYWAKGFDLYLMEINL